MICSINPRKIAALIVLLLLSNSSALALENGEPNGNYSAIGISIIKSTFETPLCVGNECHTGLGGVGLNLSYQIIPNIVVGLTSGSASSEGNTSTLTSTGGGLYVGFVAGLGSAVDVGAAIGSLSSTSKICLTSSSVCNEVSDSGTDFGLFGKVWLDQKKIVNIGISYDNYSYSNSNKKYSSVGLSLAIIPAENHEFDLSTSSTKDSQSNAVSTGVMLGYKYLFDHGRPNAHAFPKNAQNPVPMQDSEVKQPTPSGQSKSVDPVTNTNAQDAVTNSTTQKLRELDSLKKEGLITDEDYQQKKKQMLDRM